MRSPKSWQTFVMAIWGGDGPLTAPTPGHSEIM